MDKAHISSSFTTFTLPFSDALQAAAPKKEAAAAKPSKAKKSPAKPKSPAAKKVVVVKKVGHVHVSCAPPFQTQNLVSDPIDRLAR